MSVTFHNFNKMLKLLQNITKMFWVMIIMHISDTHCAKTILNGIHLATFMYISGHLLGNSRPLGKLYILFVQVSFCYFACFRRRLLGETLVVIAAALGHYYFCQADVIHDGLLPSVFHTWLFSLGLERYSAILK